jgi:hypothetical protein
MDDAQKRYTGRCDCGGVLDVNVPENQERVDDWKDRHTRGITRPGPDGLPQFVPTGHRILGDADRPRDRRGGAGVTPA